MIDWRTQDLGDKIDDTLKMKQLSVNYDKSKYLIIGSQKFRNKMLKTLKVKPMKMGGVVIERKILGRLDPHERVQSKY